MRPPWAQELPPLPPEPVNSAACGPSANKLKLAGIIPRLSTPRKHGPAKASRNETPKVITGQWAPAEVLGPYLPQRTRFNKKSFFLEGVSSFNLPKRAKSVLSEKAKSESEKLSSEEESTVTVDFDQFEQAHSLEEQEVFP